MHGDPTVTSKITNTGGKNLKITLSLYNEAQSRLNISNISSSFPQCGPGPPLQSPPARDG